MVNREKQPLQFSLFKLMLFSTAIGLLVAVVFGAFGVLWQALFLGAGMGLLMCVTAALVCGVPMLVIVLGTQTISNLCRKLACKSFRDNG